MIKLTNEKETELLTKMKETIEKAYPYVDQNSIEKYLWKWKKNKSRTYDFFSKQAEWNENELCLVIKDKVHRFADIEKAWNIITVICNKLPAAYDYRGMFSNILNNGSDKLSEISKREIDLCKITDSEINAIMYSEKSSNWLYAYLFTKLHLNIDMKKSRAVCKMIDYIMEYFKIDYKKETYRLSEQTKVRNESGGFDYTYDHNWEQTKAKLCDYLNPLVLDETFYVSINPLDYLTMSHGEGWSSCHSLRDQGCYHAATVSAMGDPSTVIVYTLNKDKTPTKNFWSVNKLTRQMLMLSKDLDGIFQQVFYPSRNTNDSTVLRNILQEKLAKYLVQPNLWVKSSCEEENINTSDWYGYDDWNQGKPSSLTKLPNTSPYFKIGVSMPCIDRSDIDITETNTIGSGCYYVCECCGEVIHEDDGFDIDGSWYCERCANEYFTQCEHCGEWIGNEDIIYVDDKPYCPYHAHKLNYKEVEDGSYRTTYVTIVIDNEEYHFSSEQSLLREYSGAKFCSDCGVYYVGECQGCATKELFNHNKEIIISIINKLDNSSQYYDHKEEFLQILTENKLDEEIKKLIIEGDFNECNQ